MKLTDIPKLMPVPFGVNGNRAELLPTSPAGDRSASYADGFPPITMLLKSAGGLPPKGENMNQILFELASGVRWINTGAGYAFNKAFCDAVGGYPKGAKLASNDGKKIYISTKNDNTTDFNATQGADWVTLNDFLGVDGKLAKDQNGADIPDKPKFIENLGLGEAAKSNVTQTTGTSTTNVMSQKAVTDALGKKLNISDANFQPKGNYATNEALNNKLDSSEVVQSTGSSTTLVMSQKAVTDKLDNKLDKSSVVQTTGQSTTQVMSQKAVSDLVKPNTASKLQNGWWRCGDTGLIYQWGTIDYDSNPGQVDRNFNFSISFTDALNVQLTRKSIGSDRGDGAAHLISFTNTNFRVDLQEIGPSDGLRGFTWVAIGY